VHVTLSLMEALCPPVTQISLSLSQVHKAKKRETG
jgi:hypothetical protein